VVLHSAVTLILGGLTLFAALGALVLFALLATGPGRSRLDDALRGAERHPIAWAFSASLVAVAGSLYFSEVAGFAPCLLCWYQRIAMYPLLVVLGVGLARADAGVWRYALPLPAVGVLISAYHVYVQWQPNADPGACGTGAPCTTRYVAVFGVVSIPVMAGAAFLLIGALMLLIRRLEATPLREDDA